MKIRVTKESQSGLKPGVYDAHKPNYPYSQDDRFVDIPVTSTLAIHHYVSVEHYELVPRRASGLGERIMTTTSQLTCAAMLSQGFDVRVRSTETGRYVAWNDAVINTNGTRPTTIDYINYDTTLRFALSRERYHWYQNDGANRQVLNINGLVTFDETYCFADYDIIHQRNNKYVFEIFA